MSANLPGIDLLRHGDTGQHSYRGQLDDSLSELGWHQLRTAVVGHRWDAIVASSMRRCAAFAGELAAERNLLLRIDSRLVEYHFGQWQGVPIETIAQEQGKALQHFWADPVNSPPPGGEPFAVFRARLCEALDEVAIAAATRRMLVVTHGGAIRLLRCMAEERDFGDMASIDVPHASLHALDWPRPAATRVSA